LFLEEIDRTAKIFKSIVKHKKVKVVSHLDADGLTSAAIISKMLLRAGVNFELRILKQLSANVVDAISPTADDVLFLADLGSGQLEIIKHFFDKTQVFVIDHHEPVRTTSMNLLHLNPLLFKEDEVSSSVICYLFAKSFSLENTDMIDLAIVGAVGDEQDEKWEFKGLARKILEEAEVLGKITTVKGIRLYGRNSRPIYKSLEYSFDPLIPGISGSESQAIQFLSELGIPVKENDEWKKLKDLTIEEQQKLASAIIIERLKASPLDATDIFGEIYTILDRPEELQDAREFATLLNACGRTNHADLGIRLCLGDSFSYGKMWEILDEYKKQISDALGLLKEGNMVFSTKNANFIIAGNRIADTLIGTVTSIALNSNIFDINKPLFGLADTDEGCVKISARASRHLKEINLREILLSAAKALNGEAGGHTHAAGGLINKNLQNDFVSIIDGKLGEILGKEKC
jgi:RecJ-like exonuclease